MLMNLMKPWFYGGNAAMLELAVHMTNSRHSVVHNSATLQQQRLSGGHGLLCLLILILSFSFQRR